MESDLTDGGEDVEVEEGVAVGLGAGEFEREAAVGGDLVGDEMVRKRSRHDWVMVGVPVKRANSAACRTQQVPWLFLASRSSMPFCEVVIQVR